MEDLNLKASEEKKYRVVKGKKYLIGDVNVKDSGEIYLINNRYIRFETGTLVYDEYFKRYTLNSKDLVEGIIKIDNKNNFIKGFFTPNKKINVYLEYNGEKHIVLNKNCLNYNFRFERQSGIYKFFRSQKASDFVKIQKVSREIKESFPYDSIGKTNSVKKKFEANYEPFSNTAIRNISKAIGKYSFGLEFETCSGLLNQEDLENLPILPLRDGSIEGLEYVTIPLSGSKGISALIDCLKVLKTKTKYDDSCSVHLHLGNIPRDEESILSIFKLFFYLQEEIFRFFPLYKRYNLGVKKKIYSQAYDYKKIREVVQDVNFDNKNEVKNCFSNLVNYLAGQENFFESKRSLLDNIQAHPQDPNGRSKWNITNRYFYINFIPIIFVNKQTIEFRIHNPTYNAKKICMFMLLNISIVDVALKNKKQIIEGTFFKNLKGNDNCVYSIFERFCRNNNVTNIYDSFVNYFESRKRDIANNNSKGNYNISEDLTALKSSKDENYFVVKEEAEEDFETKVENAGIFNSKISYEEYKQMMKRQSAQVRISTEDLKATIDIIDDAVFKDKYSGKKIIEKDSDYEETVKPSLESVIYNFKKKGY